MKKKTVENIYKIMLNITYSHQSFVDMLRGDGVLGIDKNRESHYE